jgi:plastocyanin
MSTKAVFLSAIGATSRIGTTKAISAPNTTTDAMTATAHGKQTGFGPVRLANSGGALPTGLSGSTDYWLIVVDANTIKFATSAANALAGTAVDITGAGSGTHTMQATCQALVESFDTTLKTVLTAPGNKDMEPSINTAKFWTQAIDGASF